MMNALSLRPEDGLRVNVRTLVREFGVSAALVAVLREALLGPGAARELKRVDELSDHLRADIGLPPLPRHDRLAEEVARLRRPF
jgi:hypothetical protein